MKKILILALSLVMIGQILNISSVLAMTTDDEGGEYWYMPETISYEKEIEAAVAESCASSTRYDICTSNKRVRYLIDGGNREQAVWQLKARSFTITSVNPTRSTVRVHYTGLNSSSSSEKASATELYLYWLEDGKITPQLDWTKASFYTDKIKNGQSEDGMHVIFAKNEPQVEGSEWLKTGEETRIILPTGSLVDNTQKQIFYTMVNDRGDTYSGFYDYGICIDSPEFGSGEGMECQGAFYIINSTYTYLLKSATEAEEDKSLTFTSLISADVTLESADNSEENLNEPTISPETTEALEEGLDEMPVSSSEPELTETLENDPDAESTPPSALTSTSEPVTEEKSNTPGDNLLERLVDESEEALITSIDLSERGIDTQKYQKLNALSMSSDQLYKDLPPKILKSPDTSSIFKEDGSMDPSHAHLIAVLVLLSLLFIAWWVIPISKKKKQ